MLFFQVQMSTEYEKVLKRCIIDKGFVLGFFLVTDLEVGLFNHPVQSKTLSKIDLHLTDSILFKHSWGRKGLAQSFSLSNWNKDTCLPASET